MLSGKYLKNSFHFDFIYRSTLSQNPFDLPSIKNASVLISNTSSLPGTLPSASTLKLIACSSFSRPKIRLASASINELSIKKGDPVSCVLNLSKKSVLSFLDSYSLSFSSITQPPLIFLNPSGAVVSFPLANLRYFYPYSFYEPCFSNLYPGNSLVPIFSIYFSKPLRSDSVCLFSLLFPFYDSKNKLNNFRTILREMEQFG